MLKLENYDEANILIPRIEEITKALYGDNRDMLKALKWRLNNYESDKLVRMWE